MIPTIVALYLCGVGVTCALLIARDLTSRVTVDIPIPFVAASLWPIFWIVFAAYRSWCWWGRRRRARARLPFARAVRS